MTMPGDFQPLVNNQRIVNADGTPTEYFIRWAQQKQIDISGGVSAEQAAQIAAAAIDDWAAARRIIAGMGLSGGGFLDADRTLQLNAVLGNLNDVDVLTAPPTNGQVLTYDAPNLEWVPRTPTGGGGGGGTPPVLRQLATRRGNGALTLAQPPLVGSLLLYVYGGWTGAAGAFELPRFAQFARYDSDVNNAVRFSYNFYEAGDATSWNNTANDNKFSAMYEFTGASGVRPAGGWYLPTFNSNKAKLGGSGGPGVHRIFVIENDQRFAGSIDKAGQPGIFLDYTTTQDGMNHGGCIIRTTPDYTGGAFTVTDGSGYNYSAAVYGMVDVIGA